MEKNRKREETIERIIEILIKLGLCEPENDFQERAVQEERSKWTQEQYKMRQEAAIDILENFNCISQETKKRPQS